MPCGKASKYRKKRIRSKKRRNLLVLKYKSGYVGEGKPTAKIVSSTLTPKEYEQKYYSSSEHFRTEHAIKVVRV